MKCWEEIANNFKVYLYVNGLFNNGASIPWNTTAIF